MTGSERSVEAKGGLEGVQVSLVARVVTNVAGGERK
ncbi:hypothetical protein ES702_00514 [subsurface metagenome]